jgi:hypothetical protein
MMSASEKGPWGFGCGVGGVGRGQGREGGVEFVWWRAMAMSFSSLEPGYRDSLDV